MIDQTYMTPKSGVGTDARSNMYKLVSSATGTFILSDGDTSQRCELVCVDAKDNSIVRWKVQPTSRYASEKGDRYGLVQEQHAAQKFFKLKLAKGQTREEDDFEEGEVPRPTPSLPAPTIDVRQIDLSIKE